MFCGLLLNTYRISQYEIADLMICQIWNKKTN